MLPTPSKNLRLGPTYRYDKILTSSPFQAPRPRASQTPLPSYLLPSAQPLSPAPHKSGSEMQIQYAIPRPSFRALALSNSIELITSRISHSGVHRPPTPWNHHSRIGFAPLEWWFVPPRPRPRERCRGYCRVERGRSRSGIGSLLLGWRSGGFSTAL
jgi:hypothetical protein